MEILAELQPLDPVNGARVTLRVCSADDKRLTAVAGLRWWPAISKKPTLTHDLFDGNFTGAINTGSATLELAMFGLRRLNALTPRFRWAAAPVNIYAIDQAVGIPSLIFIGVVDRFDNGSEKVKLDFKVNTAPLEGSALTLTYLGTGGIEGAIDLRGKVKPWALGACSNLEPVLIDAVNSVYQVSGYGAINAVAAVYEKAASFGAATADYPTYAALVAATIPPGRWATCLASGLFRLGAPAAGVITADVQGDSVNGYIRLTGAIITRIVQNANALPANIAASSIAALDTASLAALDVAVPRNINLYLTQQTTLISLIQELARPCNAAAGVSWLGKLFVSRFGSITTPTVTLDAQGHRKPVVSRCDEQDVQPPYWRIEMQGNRAWRVHSASEIAFLAALLDLGDYVGIKGYREGNIVVDQGARWLYVNPAPSTGNAPPRLPTLSNAYWSILSSPPDAGNLTGTIDFASQVAGATKPEANATRNVSAGTYSATAAYSKGDFVRSTDGTATYLAKSAVPAGTALTNTAFFDLFITGGGGAAGQSSFTALLTNPYIGIATDPTGANGNYTGATGVMRFFEGTVERTSATSYSSPDAFSWATINATTGAYAVTDPGVDQASVRFDGSYGGVTLRLTLNVTKTRSGTPGQAGAQLTLTASTQVFTFVDGAPAPPSQSVTLTADHGGIPGTVVFSTSPAISLAGSGDTRTIDLAALGSNRRVTVTVTIGGFADLIDIIRLDQATADPGATRNVNRGAWSAGASYSVGDFVQYSGSSYSCLTGHAANAGNAPPSSVWQLLASSGAPGATPTVLTTKPDPVQIACDYAGNPFAGQLPRDVVLTAVSGSTDVSGTATYARTNGTNAGSTLAGRTLTITSLSADAETISLVATYSGINGLKDLSLTKVKQGPSQNSGVATSTTAVTSATFSGTPQASVLLDLVANATVQVGYNGDYTSTRGSTVSPFYTVAAKMMWRNITTGGVWTDIAGSAVTGSPDNYDIADAQWQTGSIALGPTNFSSSAATSKIEVGLFTRASNGGSRASALNIVMSAAQV